MTEKNLKKLLDEELDDILGDKMPSEILNTPIDVKVEKKAKVIKVNKTKKILASISAIACCLVIAIVAMFIFPLDKKTPVKTTCSYTCHVIDINPSVMITTDENNKVVSVSAVNEDGNLVVMDEQVNSAKDLQECINAIIKCSMKLGYIDVDSKDNAIKISSYIETAQDSIKESKMQETKDIIETCLMDSGVFAVVLNELTTKQEINERFNGIDLSDENFFDSLKEIKPLTFNNGSIKEEMEKHVNNMLKAVIDDIKDTLDIICESDDEKLIEEKKNYLETKYNMSFTFFTPQMYRIGLSGINTNSSAFSKDMITQVLGDNELLFSFIFKDLPKSEDDYIKDLMDGVEKEYKTRVNSNKDKYQQKRNNITKKEYEEYLNEIISQYGTIEEYYKNKTKK